ncbi:MAG: hypothetical protein O2856_16415 [Planctomycetota bacterium]|nr:hypothetical protein [Planctomycetota bacterium]
MIRSEITTKQAFITAAIMSLMATVLLVANYDGKWLHPDTAQALSVARNIQQGNGFSTGIIYYEEHYQLNSWPALQTVFPIGFPAMIAAFGYFGVPLRIAAFLIGTIGFLLVPLLICVAAQHMGRKPATGLLLAAISLCFPMIWHNVWECQTEMMFIALTLSSLIFLQSESLNTGRLTMAGFFAATAFCLRYAGVFWLMAVGVILLLQVTRLKSGVIKQGFSIFIIPAVIAVFLFGRNAMLVGDFKGGNNKEVNRTLRDACECGYYAVSRITGLDKGDLLAGHLAELSAAAGFGLLAIATIIWLLIRLRRSESAKHLTFSTKGDAAVYLYITVSLAALIGLQKSTSINLSPRMFFPLIPFALLALADCLQPASEAISSIMTTQRRLIFSASALLMCGVLGGQFQSGDEVRTHVKRFSLVDQALNEAVDGDSGPVSPRNILAGKRILTDECHMLAESLQQDAVGLTSIIYTTKTWNDDEVIELVHKYQIDRVVVFPDMHPKDENPFFESLTSDPEKQKLPRPWLKPVLLSPRIRIYAIRESELLTQN